MWHIRVCKSSMSWSLICIAFKHRDCYRQMIYVWWSTSQLQVQPRTALESAASEPQVHSSSLQTISCAHRDLLRAAHTMLRRYRGSHYSAKCHIILVLKEAIEAMLVNTCTSFASLECAF